MGQKQNQSNYEAGDECSRCEPVLWPVEGTPKLLYARFSEIVICSDEWCVNTPLGFNDHVFTLTQLDINPCFWQYQSENFWIEYNCDELPEHKSHLYLDGFDGEDWDGLFRSTTESGEDCVTFFNNQLNCGAPHICGTGGYAIVTWRQESIDLIKSLNLEISNRLFMEMRPLADGKKVYKYCKLEDGTNVKILLEP